MKVPLGYHLGVAAVVVAKLAIAVSIAVAVATLGSFASFLEYCQLHRWAKPGSTTKCRKRKYKGVM